MIWVLMGAKLIDDMNFIIEQQTYFVQLLLMLILTVSAPIIYATGLIEDLIEFIVGEGCFDDDG